MKTQNKELNKSLTKLKIFIINEMGMSEANVFKIWG